MISGLQKMTLLDYPGKVACTVFLQGCNFRCPFCHNSGLLSAPAQPQISQQALLDFLNTRKGLLDGVCITGGEPTLSAELPSLLRAIQDMGFAVKLDTNGSRPDILKALVEENLVDYVAMDVKNSPSAYGKTIGLDTPDLTKLEESLRFLLSRAVDYELRTTVVAQLHNRDSVAEMGNWLHCLSGGNKVKRLYLQNFVDRDSVLQSGLSAPNLEDLKEYALILCPICEEIGLRGV